MHTIRASSCLHRALSHHYHRLRLFSTAARLAVVRPYLLADIGEGITECQIIQWFVQPGARVAQFDKICEVQSDKAAVEITSRFDGVIKKLHYEADGMAKVGHPLVDIDIQQELSEEDEKLTGSVAEESKAGKEDSQAKAKDQDAGIASAAATEGSVQDPPRIPPKPAGKHASLATPAVRHLTKELGINISDVQGTGRDGRVMKEDVQRHAAAQQNGSTKAPSFMLPESPGEDKVVQLSGIGKAMYQSMTNSLSIPHFLYSDSVDFTSLNRMRKAINVYAGESTPKLSGLPFIIKAASLALSAYPSINAHLDTKDPSKPIYSHKTSHNIGFAVDTPQGLMVPVIKNVQSHSISSLAAEIRRLGDLARNNKLSASDLSDATFTVSNIGAIGGGTVAPVIVSPQVAIVGVGKVKAVPAFAEDGSVIRREEAVFSWSADHRVIDGATAARCADLVRKFLENPESMLVQLR